jgi:hypothetical protein
MTCRRTNVERGGDFTAAERVLINRRADFAAEPRIAVK